MMTFDDLYVVTCLLLIVFTPALLACWVWERHEAWGQRWSDYRQARRDRRAMARMRQTTEFEEFSEAVHALGQSIGDALRPPLEAVTKAVNDVAKAFTAAFQKPAPPGTVQNPSDPSPKPRRPR